MTKNARFYQKCRRLGLCTTGCGQRADGSLCLRHKRFATKRRQRKIAAGICLHCPKPPRMGKQTCVSCGRRQAKVCQRHRRKLRVKVLTAYSKSGQPACYCCQETIIEFLTIDHIKGGGLSHLRSLGLMHSSRRFYEWLVKNEFPSGFRTACFNCNSGRRNGLCPHKRKAL